MENSVSNDEGVINKFKESIKNTFTKMSKNQNGNMVNTWGNFNYSFKLGPQDKYSHLSTNLIAEAHDPVHNNPIPI